MKKWILCLALIIQGVQSRAQQPVTYSSSDIYLQLQKLSVLGSVLYVAAHPDDENTRLLAYLAREKKYRTGYLSLTRGDGGQNLIGDEQGIELGLIRTQELLAARRIDGVEQFFTRAYDFGYSKTADETMRFWNKEKILSDVVWMIRKFQPDVIITRFPGDERAGHGHHTASALLANEAFTAAADPTKFPEQLNYGVQPWKAKRILWNSFNFGGVNTTSNDQFKVNVGAYNNLIGKGYGEIASESRSQHKSQGFGVARQRGEQLEYFTTTGGDAPKKDLLDDVATSWDRVEGGSAISQQISQIISSYSFEKPQQSVAALIQLYQSVQNLPVSYWSNKKLQEIQSVIEAASGLFAEAITPQEYGIQGDTMRMNFVLNNRNGINIKLKSISLLHAGGIMREERSKINLSIVDAITTQPLKDSSVNRLLASNQNLNIPYSFQLPDRAPVSQPYWLANGIKSGYFDVQDPLLIGRPESLPAYTARCAVEIEGVVFQVERPLQYKHTDPVKGELYQPLTILPKLVVSVSPTIALSNVKPATKPVVNVHFTSNVQGQGVPSTLTIKNGSTTDLFVKKPMDYSKGAEGMFSYALDKVYHPGQRKLIDPSMQLDIAGVQQTFSQYHKAIRYDHISPIHYFYQDNVKVVDTEIKTVGKKIGYLPGAGDRVADALEIMGYEVITLAEADLTTANLQQFDAVITGVRAYNIHPFLSSKYSDLMNYVQNGGNLVVQYNTNNQIGPVLAKIAPYPFTITRNRVTDETSPVNFALPNHPVLNYPNKITPQDFEGWIQERSIYHAEKMDTNYVAPLTMSDPGEQATGGGLIIGKYGKGNFVYTGLVFFRELPAGVPGAFRLMANLIALPKNNAAASSKASKLSTR